MQSRGSGGTICLAGKNFFSFYKGFFAGSFINCFFGLTGSVIKGFLLGSVLINGFLGWFIISFYLVNI
jgi:hypothetical protein